MSAASELPASPVPTQEPAEAADTPPTTPLLPPSEDELIPHLKVEIPEGEKGNGWEMMTKFFEKFLGHMETYVWPVDPLADVHPTLLPFKYVPPSNEQDEKFLKELCYLLTIGLQGQCFAWKYKMTFDLLWNAECHAYQALLTSVRKVRPDEFPKPASEITLKTA